MQMNVREEELLSIEFDTMWNTDVGYESAGTDGLDRLLHRFLRAHTLQTESGPIPFVNFLMCATPSTPRCVTMSVAPNSRASFCRAERCDLSCGYIII
jgi:hypothetical protein